MRFAMKPKRKKLVHGIGLNDAGYVTRKQNPAWTCPYFKVWRGMIERCYSTVYQERHPNYKGCTVANEWLTFSTFLAWMGKQDWEGKQLDKDLLVEGNKLYGPDTCVFVSPIVNTFTNDNKAQRGKWPIGVTWNKTAGKFIASCSSPITGKTEYLGSFDCELEAHHAWHARKIDFAYELAAIQTDHRVANALIDRYSTQLMGCYLPQVRE